VLEPLIKEADYNYYFVDDSVKSSWNGDTSDANLNLYFTKIVLLDQYLETNSELLVKIDDCNLYRIN